MKISGAFPVRWMAQDGEDGTDGFSVMVTPSPVVFETNSDGTVIEGTTSDTVGLAKITAKCGSETANVTFGSIVTMLNCSSCATDSANTTSTSLGVRLSKISTSSTTVGGRTLTVPETSGYAVVTVKLSCGKLSETRDVTIPFSVNVKQVLVQQYTTEESINQSVTSVKSDVSSLTTRTSTLETNTKSISATVSSHTSSIGTLTDDVSALEVQSDLISAKTRHSSYVNILSTDSDGKEDSTNYDAALSGNTTSKHGFYLRKAITKGNTYRFHAAVFSTKGGSKISSVVLKQGNTTLATLSAFSSLNAGTTRGDVEFTASADYAKGAAMTVEVTRASTGTGDSNTVFEFALLYDLEQYMLDTGFDIFGHTFQVTADNFIVLNNAGLTSLMLDSEGNLQVRGTINNDILVVDTHNEDNYLFDCPYNINETAGVTSRSDEKFVYNTANPPDKCLDLLRLPSVTIFGGMTATGFYLPSANAPVYMSDTTKYAPTHWCRTKTKYLRNGGAQWITFADLQMLLNRTFTFINRGKGLYIGLGTWYSLEEGVPVYDVAGGLAVLLGHGEFMTLTLKLDKQYGYIWEITGSSGDAACQTVERAFAGYASDWSLPINTECTLKAYGTPSGGTTSLTPVQAKRTYQYLSGSTYTTGTLLFSRCLGGTIKFYSSGGDVFGLINRTTDENGTTITDDILRGIPITKGAKHLSIRMNQGYEKDKTTWYSFGVRLILWSVVNSAVGMWAQSPRFNIIGNSDILELDLTEIFEDWSESTQYYIAMNVETFTGDRVGLETVSPATFTLLDLGLQITEY